MRTFHRFRRRTVLLTVLTLMALLAPPAFAGMVPITDEEVAADSTAALWIWEADHEVIGTSEFPPTGFIVCTTDGKATTLIGPSPGTAMDDNAAAAPNTEEPTLSTEVANMATADKVTGSDSTTPTATTSPTASACDDTAAGFISTTQPATMGSADNITETLDDGIDGHPAAGYKLTGHRVLNEPLLPDGGSFAAPQSSVSYTP